MTTSAVAAPARQREVSSCEHPCILSARERQRLDRILGLWNVLVDPKVGVIQRVTDLPLNHDDPDFFHYFSKACDTARFAPWRNFGNNGGASIHRAVAMAKAIGEGVERYCAAIYRREELQLAPFRHLRTRATHPDLFSVYRSDQFGQKGFPWQPFTVDAPVHWTPGTSLSTGETILLPAATVFVPFQYRPAEISAHILEPISTGLACGCSVAEAAVSGLCEVIERDAFSITWQAMLSCPRLRHDTLPEHCQELLRRFSRVGITVELIDITNDFGVSTIMAMGVCGAPTSPALAVAAATDPSPEHALVKSVEELAHTRRYAKHLMRYLEPIPDQREEGHPLVRDQIEHLRFYCEQESLAHARFAWASTEERDLAEMPNLSGGAAEQELEVLAARIQAVGLEPIACDLTTSDIRPLGLHVVRSVIPGAHPMYMGYKSRALGARRLYEAPQRLGHPGLDPNGPDNPYPHPFP